MKPKQSIRIAGLQMLIGNNVSENETRIINGIRKAAEDKADFLLTPEGSLSGYWAGFDMQEVADAEKRIISEAKQFSVGLALGTCFKEIENDMMVCRNQVRIYAPNGEMLGYHSKILRCAPLGAPDSCEVADYLDSPLRTFDWNGIRFGALICNDMWATPGCTSTNIPNPYLPWKLKSMGAKIILHAINSGTVQYYKPFHESSVALWARSLGIHIVEANAAGANSEPVNARSGVMRPNGEYEKEVPLIGEHYFSYDIKTDHS